MGNKKLIKVIGFAATVIGFGISLIANWVSDKKLELEIEEKVAKALAEQAK
jgi:hypothetical protein